MTLPLLSIDDTIAVWVAAHRWGPLNDPMVWLGDLERLGAAWVVLAIAFALWQRLGLWRALALGGLTALATLAADGASFAVKSEVDRARPFEAHPQIHPLYTVHSSSFPAGHAATAFAGATLLAYLVPRATGALVALAAVIGFSRIYVGVHYPSDVAAGAVLGVVVGLAAIGLLSLASRTRLGATLLAPPPARAAPRFPEPGGVSRRLRHDHDGLPARTEPARESGSQG